MQVRHIFPLLLFFLPACAPNDAHQGSDPHTAEAAVGHSDAEAHDEAEVRLSTEQVEAIGLKTGSLSERKLAGYVEARGVLDLPPDELATVTPPAEGYVAFASGDYLVGSYVKRGALLAELEHPDFIGLQQEYLEVLSERRYQEQELERQRTLAASNAGALKALQLAESRLQALEARQAGLTARLRFLGLEPDSVKAGNIRPRVQLRAPISGYINALDIHRGRYVKPGDPLYQILNTDHIHLELDVFEQDIPHVRVGQKITFQVPALGRESFEGWVKLVGKGFDMENRTVRVHGHVKGPHPEFIRGLYLQAHIWTDEKTARALPETALVHEGGRSYIFLHTATEPDGHWVFRKVEVRPGRKDGSWVEVFPLEDLPDQPAVVTEQAFYLAAEMKRGEGGGHHHH